MVVVGRYLLRRGSKGLRNKKNCGVKRGKRKDKKRVPTRVPPRSWPFSPSSAGQGVGHSLDLSGIWANETRTVHVHQYIDRAHRPRRGFLLCVCARGVQRVNITRGEKTGWRPCLVEEMFWSRGTFRSWPDLLFD